MNKSGYDQFFKNAKKARLDAVTAPTASASDAAVEKRLRQQLRIKTKKTKKQQVQYDHNLLPKNLKVFTKPVPEKTCNYQPGIK